MKRVFYYSGYRLTVFHWNNSRYVDSVSFNPRNNGLEEFRHYLQSTENTPARILVDVIEEDFRKETVPHVYGADRKAVIQRVIEKQYRKSIDYAYYKITGREGSGRKDDQLLYSVLTNPEMLNPWLNVIEETGTAISGIWSLPLISEKVLKLVSDNQGSILLVSQQVPSNLRQSYFKDGKFEISRSAVVNLDEIPLGQYITEEVDQTLRFLANKRYIGFDDAITIHVICRGEEIEEIKRSCKETPLKQYQYHDLKEVYKKAGCEDLGEEFSNGLYAHYCKKKVWPVGNYGPSRLFHKFYEQVARKAINFSSAFMILVSVFVMASYLSDASVMKNEIESTMRLAEIVNNNYEKNIKSLEARLSRTTEMKSAVLFHGYLENLKSVSPQNFMASLSHILTNTGITDTEIKGLEWQRTGENVKLASAGGAGLKIEHGSNKPVKHYAVIKGTINVDGFGFRGSVEKVQMIINAIRQNKSVEDIEIVNLPQDVRPESKYESLQGTDVDASNASMDRGYFELKLVMKGI